MSRYKRLLILAGSDPCGGAGLQADIRTATVLGCYTMVVVTALTVQNTQGVEEVMEVPSTFTEKQLRAVLNDGEADAVKIGMLYQAQTIETVARVLREYGYGSVEKPIVLDPVMVATSGGKRLLKDRALHVLKENLIPMVHLLTPNHAEASVLGGMSLCSYEDMERCLDSIAALGCENVLIKGGDMKDTRQARDVLRTRQSKTHEPEIEWFSTRRIKTSNNHGTGCTLSSAISCLIAQGEPLKKAVSKAKAFVSESLLRADRVAFGRGKGPVNSLFLTEGVFERKKWRSTEGE